MVIVDDLKTKLADGRCDVSARVRRGRGETLRLHFEFDEDLAPAAPDGSPFLSGVLMWAMRAGEDITVDAPVSGRLLRCVDEILAVSRSMWPERFRRTISVSAPAGRPPEPHPRTASFFSRGVDSWFGVLSALEDDPQTPPLTHIVFSPDFFPIDRWPAELAAARARATIHAARRTDCRVVELRTNLKRDFGGAQLTSSALALGFQRMLIPSGSMHGEIAPSGTHLALDHRYSTDRTQIVHYGDANRLDKVRRIAQSTDAMETLHVCRWNSASREANCCRCEKCLRTMLELHVAGALQRATQFTEPLTPAAVARMDKRLGNRHIWREILHALGGSDRDRELAAAVRLVVARSDLREAAYELREAGTDPSMQAIGAGVPSALRRAATGSLAAHRALDPDAHPRLADRARGFGGRRRQRARDRARVVRPVPSGR